MSGALIVTLMVFAFMMTGFATEPINPVKAKSNKVELIELNLLNGVSSENEGLQTSSAYFLGELKSRKAVIALMHLLHTGETEEARIVAALSLYKIGDARGMYAVQQNIKFDPSDKVRRMCENFYLTYLCDCKKK